MTLEEKVDLLQLIEVDDEYYSNHLREWDEYRETLEDYDGVSLKDKYDYYKIYCETPMNYPVEYIEKTPIEELIRLDKKNEYDFYGPLEKFLS